MKHPLFFMLLSLILFSHVQAQNIDSFTVSDTTPGLYDMVYLVSHSTNYTSLEWIVFDPSGNLFSSFPNDSIVNTSFYIIGCYDINLVVGRGAVYDTITKTCAVKVMDRISPIISLTGYSHMKIERFCQFIDPGVIVADNYWSHSEMTLYSVGTVDSSTLGTYKIRYWVVDGSGNTSGVVERIVEVINAQPPKMKDTIVYVEVYHKYESGTWIKHYCCDSLDIQVFSESNVDTSKLGTYYYKTWLTDCHGLKSDTAVQVVHVVDKTPPVLFWQPQLNYYVFKRWDTLRFNPLDSVFATDNYDLNPIISVSGTYYSEYLKSFIAGNYNIILNAVDQSGNWAKTFAVNIYVQNIHPSVAESEKSLINVFPNPSTGRLIIENMDLSNPIKSVRIFNSHGQLVYISEGKLDDQVEILLNQPSGLYFIHMMSENSAFNYKLLIE